MSSISQSYANAATFSGRMSRRDYFGFIIVHVLVSVAVVWGLFYLAIDVVPNALTLFFVFPLSVGVPCAVGLPFVSATVRRLHDIGCSGWVAASMCFPFLAFVVLVIALLAPGSKEYNKYGHSPKAMQNGEVSLEDFGKD